MAAGVGGPVTAQVGPRGSLEPDDAGWEVAGDATVGEVEGRPALLLRRGQAEHHGVELADGTLAFEVRIPEGRTFVGIKLRIGPDGTFEDFYLRPHKSGLPDAVQYNPSFGGAGQWQLWHGPGSTAFADLEGGRWLPVRVELSGRHAALFLGDAAEPTLVAHDLATGRTTGGVGFWANRPGATDQDPWTAAVRDVRVLPGVTTWDFAAPPAVASPAGTIERWELSEAWAAAAAAADSPGLPSEIVDGAWSTVEVEPGGLLAIQRHRSRPEGGMPTVLARHRIDSGTARTVTLHLGFSDDVSVWLNGRRLAGARNGYSYNFPRRDGLLTPDQLTVDLPLRPGANEVVVRVSDGFGGWGLQGRIDEGVDPTDP